ncbi:unnamed protein product [Ophioblennius macclurei]
MHITDIAISLDKTEESQLTVQNFTKDETDLNEGAGGKKIYLWYKEETVGEPITRIQFSYCPDMEKGLYRAGYQKIEKDLNAGAGGDKIYLWFYKGTKKVDVPIKGLHISTDANDEAQKMKLGWERLTCDLNRKTVSNWIYLWVKRERPMFISDIVATSDWSNDQGLLEKGYTRMDENTNKSTTEKQIFLWYRNTLNKEDTVRELQVSTNDDMYANFKARGFQLLDLDLNMGTRNNNKAFLWLKKSGSDPIRGIAMIRKVAVDSYEAAGANNMPLIDGDKGIFSLCYYR